MEQMIPGFLEEMLKKQYGEEAFAKILAGYQARRPVTLRRYGKTKRGELR